MTLGFNSKFNVTAETTAEPTLERMMVDDQEIDYYNFENNTLITVEYSVARDFVDGVVLVGEGSGLDLNPVNGLNLSFSYSYREKTFYTLEFEIYENMTFKAFGWVGDKTNGTYEEVEDFNHLGPWHYLFVNEQGLPPEFHGIVNATQTGFHTYYAPSNQTNHTIVISYRVYGEGSNENITLVTSIYRDKLYNASLNIFDSSIQFTKMVYQESTEPYVIYNTTITFTERTLYFAANTSFGWDSYDDGVVKDSLNIYEINNGFDFESDTILQEPITDVDDVEILITALNSTETETYGIGYYVIESLDNDTEIVEWTEVEGTLQNNYTEENDLGNNDTIREFNISLGIFDVDNIIYFEAYSYFNGERYNETSGNYHAIRIYESIPDLVLNPKSESYVNHEDVSFTFDITLYRGNITEILLDYDDGSPIANLTALEPDEEDGLYHVTHVFPILTDGYNITLTVTTSLGTSNSTTNYLYIDFDAPTLEITGFTANATEIIDGYVELYFDYEDDYSGIWTVYIDWGDGVVQNATDEHFAFHYYVKDGTYEATIEVQDNGGNTFSLSIIYTINLPDNTPTVQVPLATISIFVSIILLGGTVYLSKRRR